MRKRNTQRIGTSSSARLPVVAAAVLAGLLAGVAEAGRTRSERPRYEERKPTAVARQTPETRVALPSALAVDPVESARSATDPGHRYVGRAEQGAAGTRPGARDRYRGHAESNQEVGDWLRRLDTRARDAGSAAADEQIDYRGLREYYRVGFYEGLRGGLRYDRPSRQAWFDGRRDGARDPRARRDGLELGRGEAERMALHDAERRVRDQFSDLAADPRFSPLTVVPDYNPPRVEHPEPRLRDVVDEFPIFGLRGFADRPRRYLRGWDRDVWSLVDCPEYTRFYDGDWRRSDLALLAWRDRHGRRAGYFRLERHDRERFDLGFVAAFERRLAFGFRARLSGAYDVGFDDGWTYGAFLDGELQYRRAYDEGYGDAFSRFARESFDATYPAAHRAAYRERFDDWSTHAKLAIGDVRLVDGDDDGVFAPGDRLVVEYELINYGGGVGEFPVSLEGRVLSERVGGYAAVRSRSLTPATLALARIAPSAPPRTRSVVELTVGDARRQASFTVRYPLEIVRSEVGVQRDNTGGRLVVDVAVANLSRRPVAGHLRVDDGGSVSGRRAFEAIEPGRRASIQLALVGLDPLAMIGGDVDLGLEVVAGEVVQDRYRRPLPDVVRDLENRELLLFMIGMARVEQASAAEIARARQLMLRRLREDWKVAAMGSGNPYKRDYRHDSGETALGDLVHTLEAERSALRDPEVFGGLSDDVLLFSRTLPGVHPLLRKYVRRLAGELP